MTSLRQESSQLYPPAATSPSETRPQLAIFKRQVREGCYQKKQPLVKETTTLGDLWQLYEKSYQLAGKKALWRQKMAWAHLKGKFEKMRPERLTTAELIAYQESRRAAGASAATVNRDLAALSAALYNAAKMIGEGCKPLLGHVPIYPAKLPEAAPRKGFIEEPQYRTLAANAKPLWLRCLIACAYSFGFRKSELLNLKVRQVDFFDRWLELGHGTTKNGEGRKVKMTAEVFELMRACVSGKKPGAYVFTREDGAPVRDLRAQWYELCIACKLGQWIPAKRKNGKDFLAYRGLDLHDFRRSAVRNLVRAGVSEKVCMEISGHKTRAIFDNYNLSNEADLSDATRKLELRAKISKRGASTSTKTDTSAFSASVDPSQNPRM